MISKMLVPGLLLVAFLVGCGSEGTLDPAAESTPALSDGVDPVSECTDTVMWIVNAGLYDLADNSTYGTEGFARVSEIQMEIGSQDPAYQFVMTEVLPQVGPLAFTQGRDTATEAARDLATPWCEANG